MEPHPVRVTIDPEDDLKRWRLTVAFRLILAIPHLVWFLGWTLVVPIAAFFQWLFAIFRGRPDDGMNRFLGSYIRYLTHLYAYLSFAADPYPQFLGRPGYPVDLEIDEPEDPQQERWTIVFRFILVIPAALIAATLVGIPMPYNDRSAETDTYSTIATSGGGLIFIVGFLAWFACLATGRVPHGFRGLAVYALRYGAQFYAYLFIITGRYPTADPFDPPPLAPETTQAVRIRIEDDLERSRLTVFFRLLLTIPHIVWLILWGILAFLVAILNWFATLFMGRSPEAFHNILAAYLRYTTHVYAFLFLVANPFPGFTGEYGSYPIDLEIDPPAPQHRLKTLFRLILAIPAFFVSSGLSFLLYVIALLGWFAALVTGRMPLGLRNAGAYVLRYNAQVGAYAIYLLADRYPYSGPAERFGEPAEDEAPAEIDPFEPAPFAA